jgi:hypothetical protein
MVVQVVLHRRATVVGVPVAGADQRHPPVVIENMRVRARPLPAGRNRQRMCSSGRSTYTVDSMCPAPLRTTLWTRRPAVSYR